MRTTARLLGKRLAGVEDRFCAAVLLVLCTVCAYPRLSGPIDIRWDAAKYYVLGTSLALGHGYRLISEPGDMREVQYPPVVPAFIALHQLALRSTDPVIVGRWLKVSWLLMFLVLILATYRWLRETAPPWLALAGASLAIFNLQLYFQASQCSADLPFALASCVFVWVARGKPKPGGEALAGGVAALAYFIRTVGVALFAAWIIDGLIRRQYKKAILRSCAAAGCLLVWNGYIREVERSPEYRHPAYEYQRAAYQCYNVSYARNMAYVDPFQPEFGIATRRQLLQRFVTNAELMPESIGEAVSVPLLFCTLAAEKLHQSLGIALIPGILFQLILSGLAVLVIAGVAALLLRGEWLVPLYIGFTLAIICAAPWPTQITRYMSPLVPFLLFALFAVFGRPGLRKWAFALAAAILTAQLGIYAFVNHTYSVRGDLNHPVLGKVTERHLFFKPVDLAIDASLGWIAKHSTEGDIIGMDLPQKAFLKTGRKAVMPPLEIDPALANRLLAEVPVRYVLLQRDQNTFLWKYMWGVISAYPAEWNLVFRSPGDLVLVYERTSQPGKNER